MQYDSLGRKSNILNPSQPAMHDPDMGDWNYAYDVNGNLTRQTDARGQRICFFYDTIDRLTGKHYNGTSDTCPTSTASGDIIYAYDEAASSNGKGQRTSISNPSATTRWQYDARGRKTQEVYSNVAALPAGQTRTFQWSYDSADRVQTITYPSNEVVTYSYDAAWRPASACSSLGGCYISSSSPATYTALDQPQQWTFGNTAVQTWSYSSPLQRLSQLQVNGAGNTHFDRGYSYDAGGNVLAITDNTLSPVQTQHFDYDERDRLTHFWSTIGSGKAAPALAAVPDANGGVPKLFAPASTTSDRPLAQWAPPAQGRRPTTDYQTSDQSAGGERWRRGCAARRSRPVRRAGQWSAGGHGRHRPSTTWPSDHSRLRADAN